MNNIKPLRAQGSPMRGALRHAGAACAVLVPLLLAGCLDTSGPDAPNQEIIDNATIELPRPGAPAGSITPGMYALGLATPRDGFLYVPPGYDPDVPTPLLVLLHGAGGSSAEWNTTERMAQFEASNILILAIDSRFDTWDYRVLEEYKDDVDFLHQALEYVFSVAHVDSMRMTIGGFSDGASEAIGIGLVNAHLFSRVIAWSPGELAVPFKRGTPQVYVSHGQQDEVLPYLYTRDVTVINLVRNGCPVIFKEFQGGHIIPAELFAEAVFLATQDPPGTGTEQ